MNDLTLFIDKLKSDTTAITFQESISVIDQNYYFTPTAFKNGNQFNDVNQNNGSCKLFAFAQLNNLNQTETLALFGDFYFIDVVQNPTNTDHQNIRNFITYSWGGIEFTGTALVKK